LAPLTLNLDDDLIARLKRRAARHGSSTEAEHREILRQALLDEVEPSFDTLAAELRKLTRRNLRAAAAFPSGSTTTPGRNLAHGLAIAARVGCLPI
jgi:plasmid stability protein